MIGRPRLRAIMLATATGVGFLAIAAAPANAATAIEYGLSAPAPTEGTDSSVIRPEQMAVGNGATTDASLSKPPQ